MKKQLIHLIIYILISQSLFSQNQINGYDFITNLNNDFNYGNIDFYVKDVDPCSTTNEKSVFGFNAISLNPSQKVYLNFKIQVTDCYGKIYEQSISIPIYKLGLGFTENIVSWELSGKLTMPPYQIAISNNSDRTKLVLKGQLKPSDPDSLVIRTRKIMYGKNVQLEIIGGDDLTNSQNTYWSWRIGSPNAQEIKTQKKQYSFVAESNTTVYVNAVSKGVNNTIVTSKTVTKNVIVDTKSLEPSSISIADPLLCSTSKDGTILSINDGILGKNAYWVWYQNGCGQDVAKFIELDKSLEKIRVMPNVTTTYFVRAESSEGANFTTNCKSITVKVVDPPVRPNVNINGNTSRGMQICEDQMVNLNLQNQGILNQDNSYWEWYYRNADVPFETATNLPSVGIRLDKRGIDLSFTAKNKAVYYAISNGGVCNSVTSETAFIDVKKKTQSYINIELEQIGKSHNFSLKANEQKLGDGSKYIWYTGQKGYENQISNLQEYGQGSSVKIKSRSSENRYVYLSGVGLCDNPQIINGSRTIDKHGIAKGDVKMSQFILNFGGANTEDPNLITSSIMIGGTFKKGGGFYFKYVSTNNSGIFETNGLVVDKTTQLISNYPNDGTYYKYISDAKIFNAKSYILGGILTDKKQVLNLYYGVGYGKVETIWGFNKYKTASNNFLNVGYAKNQEKSFGGLALELGVMLRLWYFNITGGLGVIGGTAQEDSNSQSVTTASSNTQTFVNGHFGIGISILSRSKK